MMVFLVQTFICVPWVQKLWLIMWIFSYQECEKICDWICDKGTYPTFFNFHLLAETPVLEYIYNGNESCSYRYTFFTTTHKVFTQFWQELWCYGDGDRHQALPIVPHAVRPTWPTSIALYNMQTSNVWLVAYHLNNHHGRSLTSNQWGRSTFLWTLSQYPQTPTFSKLEQGQQNSCSLYQDSLWMLG